MQTRPRSYRPDDLPIVATTTPRHPSTSANAPPQQATTNSNTLQTPYQAEHRNSNSSNGTTPHMGPAAAYSDAASAARVQNNMRRVSSHQHTHRLTNDAHHLSGASGMSNDDSYVHTQHHHHTSSTNPSSHSSSPPTAPSSALPRSTIFERSCEYFVVPTLLQSNTGGINVSEPFYDEAEDNLEWLLNKEWRKSKCGECRLCVCTALVNAELT